MAFGESIFSAIANVFGLTRDRSALRNSPAMQASKAAKTDAAIKAKSTAAVASAKAGYYTVDQVKALEKIRRLTAE